MGVIQRQSIKNFFTSYIGVLIGFINLLVVQPRFLTPEELGLTRVLYSFAVLLATVVPLGSGNIAIKFFPHFRNAESKHHGFFGFLTGVSLIGFLFTTLLLLLFKSIILSQYAEKSALFTEFFVWVFPLILFLALITQLNIYCYSLYKSTVPAFLNDVVARIGVIVLISLYFLKLFSLKTFITLFVAVYGLQVVALLIYIFYEEKPAFKINFNQFKKVGWKPILKFGFIIWLASISSMGIKELATILLGTKVALGNVAVYVVAAFIPTLIEVPLNALDKIATYNITTALVQNKMDVVNDIYKKSAKYMLVIGGLLFLLINGNITSILQFLPEKYRGGELIILILSFGTLFNMATGLNSQVLVYSSKYIYGSIMLIVSVLLNFFLLVILIPLYGVLGAAIATALSGVVLNLINTLILYWNYCIHPLSKHTLASILLIALIFTLQYFLPHLSYPVADILIHSLIISSLYTFIILRLNIIPEFNSYIVSLKDSLFKRN